MIYPPLPGQYVMCLHGLRHPSQTPASKFSASSDEVQMLTTTRELVEDVISLNTSKIKYLGLKVTNNNRTQPASSIPLIPDNISGARTDRNFSTEPAGISRKNEKTVSSTRGTSRLSYVTTNHRQLRPPKLSLLSKGFRGCTLSPDGTKLL